MKQTQEQLVMAAFPVAQTYHLCIPDPMQYTAGYKVCNQTM